MGNKYEKYLTFDDPIPYWQHDILEKDRNDNNCLLFYPVLIKDIFEFYNYVGCLLTDHTSKIDTKKPFDEIKKILSMSCYEYLWYSTFLDKEDKPYIYQFNLLLSLVLNRKEFRDFLLDRNLTEFKKIFLSNPNKESKPIFVIDEIVYDSIDFDEIKKIIALQNDLELPDIETDIKFREMIAEQKRLLKKLKGGNAPTPTFEEEMICLSISTGISIEEVKKLTLRKFIKSLRYIDKKLHYEAYLTASLSGFVTFKDDIEHWMSSIENENKLKGVLMNFDEFEKKVDG